MARNTKPEAPEVDAEAEAPAAPEAPKGALEVSSNNAFTITDNTDAPAEAEREPEATHMELLGGLVQTTYR